MMEFSWHLLWQVPLIVVIGVVFWRSQLLVIGSKGGKTTSTLAHSDRQPPPAD